MLQRCNNDKMRYHTYSVQVMFFIFKEEHLCIDLSCVKPPPYQHFLNNSRTIWATEIKLCPREQNFLRSIFKSKAHLSVAHACKKMAVFETWSGFTDQLLGKLKPILSFSSERHDKTLKLSKMCHLDQRIWLTRFHISHVTQLMMSLIIILQVISLVQISNSYI